MVTVNSDSAAAHADEVAQWVRHLPQTACSLNHTHLLVLETRTIHSEYQLCILFVIFLNKILDPNDDGVCSQQLRCAQRTAQLVRQEV